MTDSQSEYSSRLDARLKVVAEKERAHLRIGYVKLAAVIAGIAVAWLAFSQDLLSPYWLFLPAGLYVALAIAHEYVIRARTRAEAAADYFRKGIARMEDRWAGSGQTGERFLTGEQTYADDLDLFGRGSLFELLSTARLPMGENRLARWLTQPSSADDIIERQRSLVELRELHDFREQLAVTGESLRLRLDPESLLGWAGGPPQLPGAAWRIAAAGLALAFAGGVVYLVLKQDPWPLITVFAAEMTVRRWLGRKAEAAIGGIAACNAEGLVVFSKILKRLETQTFAIPRLQEFSARIRGGNVPASAEIRKLARIMYWVDGRESLLGHLLELFVIYSVHVGFAADAWRRRCGSRVHEWVEITAEMEAQVSLATYSFEHPTDSFPEFTAESAGAPAAEIVGQRSASSNGTGKAVGYFDGEELGHPLLPTARCVRNSVYLGEKTRVLLVSGSNMSGKSTLMRTVGINTVLAMAGAPVRAKRLRLCPMVIGTRIRSGDSLQEGRSGFYSEILRIRRVFELASRPEPLLFLFDELLEGTNSKDRCIGAESLIRVLVGHRAVGIVTTHDLALTKITEAMNGHMRNMHLQDFVEDGKMKFDYKLRDGVVTKSNAVELMRLIGFEI